jgi:mono/diheme cytochrome c family protein
MPRAPLIESIPARWRLPVAVVVALGVMAALYFTGRYFRDEPVTYDSPEEHFKYGSTGGERASGFPYWIWRVLPALFPEYLPGGKYLPETPLAPLGFIYEPGKDLPVGVSRRNVQGLDRVFLNCAVCHAGTYRESVTSRPEIVLGMPANTVDLQGFQQFLFDCATDERFTPDRLMAEIEKIGGDLDWLNENALRKLGVFLMRDRLLLLRDRFRFLEREPDYGPGRVDTFNAPKVLMNFPMGKLPQREWVGLCDFPSIWLQRQREGMQLHWDGNNTSVQERNRSAAFGTGAYPPTLDRPLIRRVENWIMDARPKPFPFPIDQARAADGAKIYEAHCASCHGRSGTDFSGSHVGKVTPIDAPKLRTDRWRLDSYSPELAANQNQLYAGYGAERFSHFRKTFGYANMPLDGLWLRAPYLHNGSVPALRDLLEPAAARPAVFFRGYDVYDPVRVGFVSNVAVEPAESAQVSPQLEGRRYFRFETQARSGESTGAFAKVISIDVAKRQITLDRPLRRAVEVARILAADGTVLVSDAAIESGMSGALIVKFQELPPELKAGTALDYSTPRERNEGNGNQGHEYGTDLDEPSKAALLEYLKTF